MLGKLLKHDFIATWKVPVSLDAALILMGILSAVMVQTIPYFGESFGTSVFIFSFFGLYYIGIIAANIVILIYLVMRYYRNLYTSEGYLTFTLPVKTDMIVHSKVITGSVWLFLSYLCTFISIIIAGSGFIKTINVPKEELLTAFRKISSVMGFSDPGFWVILILMILITPVAGVLCMYFCVSVGQLWQNHKVLGAVLCIIGLHIFNQIVSQVAFFGSGFFTMMASSPEIIDAAFGHIYKNMLTILSIITLIQGIIYYIVCLIINRKKINLD